MNPLPKIFFLLALALSFNSAGQTDSTRWGIGANLVPLYSGTPEMQLEYFPIKSWGLSVNFGCMNKAVRGGFLTKADHAEIFELTGYYFKTGIKFRTPSRPGKSFLWFGQLFYVYSAYHETGTTFSPDPQAVTELKGSVNGIAANFGFEFRLVRCIHFRSALQFGTYSRRAHLGFYGHTFQPGLGASGPLFNNQIQAGLCFKF